MLWLGEIAHLICNFYLSGSIYNCLSRSNPEILSACCWDVKQPTNNNSELKPSAGIFLTSICVADQVWRGTVFFCIWCDNHAKSSGWWLLGSPLSAVVWHLVPRAWCPLQCLLAKTVGVLFPGVGRSEECAQEFAPQSHIHSGLYQQDLISLDVFLVHSYQYADRKWWFGSSCQGC